MSGPCLAIKSHVSYVLKTLKQIFFGIKLEVIFSINCKFFWEKDYLSVICVLPL